MSTDTPHEYPAWVDAQMQVWAFEEAQERGRLAMAERCASFGLALANGWLERRLWARAQWKSEMEFLGIEWPPDASFVPMPADPDAVVAAVRKLSPLEPLPILSAGDVAGDHIPGATAPLVPGGTMNEQAIPTAVDLSLSPIDREWLRDRLIEFGLKRADVHRSIDFCVAYLDTCGLGTRREVEDLLNDEATLSELRDVYTTVLRRPIQLEPLPAAHVSVRLSMTAVRATVRAIEPLLDPVGLCQWGGLLRVRKQIGGDIGLREASRGLRQLLVQYPEAIAGLARVHQVQPNGAAIEPPQPEPAARDAAAAAEERRVFEFKPKRRKKAASKAKPRSKAKARRR